METDWPIDKTERFHSAKIPNFAYEQYINRV